MPRLVAVLWSSMEDAALCTSAPVRMEQPHNLLQPVQSAVNCTMLQPVDTTLVRKAAKQQLVGS